MASDPRGADVVVILSYKGAADTLDCVESVVTGSPQCVVLVVDNGSADDLLDQVRRRWPDVHTLQTGDNLGFSGGMNAGLRWALAYRAATITILNNDTLVEHGTIERLSSRARGGNVVSPEVRFADGSEDVWFGGGLIDAGTALPRHATTAELVGSRGDPGVESETLAGCCLTAEAGTWLRVGLLDDRYFLMFEDSEWSLRARRLGYPLLVDRSVVIRHKVSASFGGPFAYLGVYYYVRNGLLFGSVYHPWDLMARLRFLRQHAMPLIKDHNGAFEWPASPRRAVMVVAGVAARGLHVYGRAPRLLERLARRWAAPVSH